MHSACRDVPSSRLILHLPCLSSLLVNGERFRSKSRIWPCERNVPMVNCLMFNSETPNNSRPREFAATRRWSPSVTTIPSRELASSVCKSFSLARRASRSLRGLSTILLPNLTGALTTLRMRPATFLNTRKSCEQNLVIFALVTAIASRILAPTRCKPLSPAQRALSSLSAAPLPRLAIASHAPRKWTATCSNASASCDRNSAFFLLMTPAAS